MTNRKLVSLFAAGVSQLALSSVSAMANTVTTDASADFSMETIVVSATRTAEKLEDVAASVSVLTQAELEKNLATDIRDMLRYEPGVEATNAGRFGLSGFNIRGLTGNRVKILVDGTEQSEGFASGPWLNSPRNFVDIDSLAQVEVLRGPASSLYGSDALAGVVSFRTKSPSAYLDESGDDTGGHVKVLYDSVTNMFSETATIANRTGKLETLFQYTRRDGHETENFGEDYSDAQGNDRTLPDPYEFGSDNFLAKVEYQASENHRLKLVGEYFRSKSHSDLLSLEGPTYNAMFNYSDYTGDDVFTRKHVGFTHEWTAGTALFDTVSWTLDWQKSDAEEETNNTTAAFGYGHRLIDYRHGEEDYQASAQFDKETGVHHFTYGLVYQHATLENRTDKFYLDGTRDDEIARYTPVVKGKTFGVYLQDQISLLEGDLLLSPGVRYDYFKATPEADDIYTTDLDKHTSDKVTFRSGVVYKFDDVVSAFGQFSQGFKAPELIQLYRQDTSSAYRGYITLSNPDLKPESSNSFELGLRAGGKLGSFELVGFHSSYDDFIEQTIDRTSGISVYQYTNYAEATIKGIEARAAIWLDQALGAPKGLAFQAAFAYAKGDTTEGDVKTPIDSVAPTKAVLGLTYDAPNERWGMGVNTTIVGGKDTDRMSDAEGFAPDGYTTIDITGYINFTDQLSLRAGLFNLTNQEYWLWEDARGYAANTSYLDRFTQPGRNASISLQYRF
ncbi:MAG: TonB-dependent hemoglobin/transferrin/lactoferrin family receptor [Alphaproteobacteria bacterium]|nr:TonB-dependent hemoglobin/transferrin/lactoferrin family receptor [Alphaproteobacteria bacterium]